MYYVAYGRKMNQNKFALGYILQGCIAHARQSAPSSPAYGEYMWSVLVWKMDKQVLASYIERQILAFLTYERIFMPPSFLSNINKRTNVKGLFIYSSELICITSYKKTQATQKNFKKPKQSLFYHIGMLGQT